MAGEMPGKLASYVSESDLTSKQYYFVKKGTAANSIVVCTAAGEQSIGIVQNNPNVGEAASVMWDGLSKCVAGTTIADGDLITPDSAGKAGVAVKGKVNTSDGGSAADPLLGSYVAGSAEGGAAAAEIFSVRLQPMGAVVTTAS